MGRDSKGAAAVEFALVLPILLVLVLGIIEFGYLAYANASAAGAAREGARVMALTDNEAAARATAADYFVMSGVTPEITVKACGFDSSVSTESVQVRVAYKYGSLTGWFGSNLSAHGIGKMRCGG